MSLLLCRQEHVTHPYYIEHLGIHLYSSQELCYIIYHHPFLVLEDFCTPELLGFISGELGLGFLALKMERWLKSNENPDDVYLLFLQECGYYSTPEINQWKQKVSRLRKLPKEEYKKQKADYFFECRQYGKAIAVYESILENKGAEKLEREFQGKVWNNLGSAYARVFQFEKAMDAFDHAWTMKKEKDVLKRIYLMTRLNPSMEWKERYEEAVSPEWKEQWENELSTARNEAKVSKDLEQIGEIFHEDSEESLERAGQLVQQWKREYRGMA